MCGMDWIWVDTGILNSTSTLRRVTMQDCMIDVVSNTKSFRKLDTDIVESIMKTQPNINSLVSSVGRAYDS
jgi:hypothetical protein